MRTLSLRLTIMFPRTTLFQFLLFLSLCIFHSTAYRPSFSSSSSTNKPPMRAWTCHGRTQREMVDRLTQAGLVQSATVRQTLLATDRRHYNNHNNDNTSSDNDTRTSSPYRDTPVAIGYGQTISAPHMHAHALEELFPYVRASMAEYTVSKLSKSKEEPQQQQQCGVRILDVGCGSGYLTACLGRMVQLLSRPTDDNEHNDHLHDHHVYGMDIHSHLVERTRRNMETADADLLSSLIVDGDDNDNPNHSCLDGIVAGLATRNGWSGWPEHAPFDAIHVGAAAAAFPLALAQQLTHSGVMIVPMAVTAVGRNGRPVTMESLSQRTDDTVVPQALYKVVRAKQEDSGVDDPMAFYCTPLLGVRYVPLVQQLPD